MSAEDISLALVNDALTERVQRETTSVQTEWIGRVVSKDQEGVYYVDVTGGANAMPCVRTLVDVSIGQTVDVRIQNGHAIIVGCRSDPVPTASSVNTIEKKVTTVRKEVQIIRTEKADVTELTAAKAEIIELRAGIGEFETVVTQDLIAANADIANLKAKDVTIEGNLSAATGRIGTLESDNVTIKGRLDAAEADIDDLEADTAKIHNLTADQLTATVGYIGDLTTDNITAADIAADHATVGNLDTNYAHITNGVIDNATINQAKINDLAANYAKIDGANITTATIRDAWVDKLMVQSGLIAHEGTVYELDAIQVNASKIKAGTLDVERLVVTQNGQKYLVHVNAQGTATYEKLDGDIIEDLTITADKIVAGAITAQKITTENLVGSGGWINLRNGTFNYMNATTGDGIAWDGQHLTINAASIDAKVSKDGVIAAINLSTEQSGGSAVKISADKVNIEGAAIFTGSGRLSQTSLNSAYDAAGSASAAQAAAISAAASDATSKANAAEANAKAAIPTDISDLNNDAGYQTSSDVSAAISSGTANLAAKADAVARTQRIYYRQTASGSAPGVNNTWLSTSGTGYGNWSLSIPQLTSGETKYPKLYMATQTQTVAQKAAGSTCTCTTPALDDSTTIIDGGNIITGSVTANQLSANSVTADKIASNAITVGKMPSSDQASILNSNVTIGNVNGLQDALNGKETAGAAAAVQQTLETTIDGVAQEVQNKADSASLDSTNDDLTQLVAGLSTSDHFNVNDDGTYTFGLDDALDGVEAKAARDLSDSERVLNDKIDANVADLLSEVSEASQANLYIHFDEASDGLEIGKNLDGTAGVFRQLMDDQGTHWQYNREDAAYVGVNDEGKGTMFLDEAQVTGRLRVGNYIFMGNDAGTRMSLKWIGD